MRRRPKEEIHLWDGADLGAVQVTRSSGDTNPTLSIAYGDTTIAPGICTIDLEVLQSALEVVARMKSEK